MGLKGGIALITVLVIIAIIFVAAGSIILSSLSELKMARMENYSTKAFYLAEGGIERGIFELKNNFSSYDEAEDFGGMTHKTVSGSAEDGTYSVKIYQPVHEEGSNTYTYALEAEGTVNNIGRMVSQSITVQLLGYWPYAFDYALFSNSGTTTLRNSVGVTGSVYQNGDLYLGTDAAISGTPYVTGYYGVGQGASPPLSVYPVPGVPMPSLNTSTYDDKITYAAENVPVGNQNYTTTLDLGGGTVYVNGNVATSNITGPGTLVATGNISIGQGSTIGQGITIIADGDLEFKQGSTVGENSALFSSTSIQIKEGGVVMTHTSMITPGTIVAYQSVIFATIMYAGGSVQFDQAANITGSVVSGAGIDIKAGSTITYDTSVFPSSPPPGFSGGRPVVNITTSAWKEIF